MTRINCPLWLASAAPWRFPLLFVIVLVLARIALAEPEADFHAAEQRAAAGDPGAIDALETIGAARPVTRWTDDAWMLAARLAERAGDYDRARRDLGAAIAVASDDQLRARAEAELARIATFTGAAGQWSAIAAEHERLVENIAGRGDPKPALHELEALVRANPQYPRAAMAMLAIARGWQRDGDQVRALAWLREAAGAMGDRIDHQRALAELVRGEIRTGDIEGALAHIDSVDPAFAPALRAELATARKREMLRWILWSALAAIAIAAVVVLRRASGSWRAAARRLLRPPAEAVYYVPIALVLVIVAMTGNPMVARAVRAIAIVGALVAWLSGAILDAVRARGRVAFSRALGHAAIAVFAVGAATYLAIDRDRMIDLIVETWRSGPAPK